MPGAAEISPWSRDALAGRLVELSDTGQGAPVTMAVALVLDAQRRRETVAWVTSRERSFFPPDVAASGVDLDALAVIRVPGPSCVGANPHTAAAQAAARANPHTAAAEAMARTADRLLRSGAFGLVVLDLGTGDVAMSVQARLLGLAERHDAAVVCLTEKPRHAPSLSSLVSLRVETSRRRLAEGSFACTLTSVKDKRRPPGWTVEEVRDAPAGMR